MKQKFTRILRTFMIIMFAITLMMPGKAQAASKPKISKTKVTLTHAKKKGTYNLKVKNIPSGGKVVWSTSNKKVARVAKVKATKTTSTYKAISITKGKANIYAKVYNKKGKLVKKLKCVVTSKKNHNFKSKVTKKATSSSVGVRTYTCSCGASYSISIPKLTDIASSVNKEEETVGNNGCTHAWSSYSYLITYKEYNPKSGTYSTYKVYQCSVCKEKDYREVNTSDSYMRTIYYKYCSTCGARVFSDKLFDPH